MLPFQPLLVLSTWVRGVFFAFLWIFVQKLKAGFKLPNDLKSSKEDQVPEWLSWGTARSTELPLSKLSGIQRQNGTGKLVCSDHSMHAQLEGKTWLQKETASSTGIWVLLGLFSKSMFLRAEGYFGLGVFPVWSGSTWPVFTASFFFVGKAAAKF